MICGFEKILNAMIRQKYIAEKKQDSPIDENNFTAPILWFGIPKLIPLVVVLTY